MTAVQKSCFRGKQKMILVFFFFNESQVMKDNK